MECVGDNAVKNNSLVGTSERHHPLVIGLAVHMHIQCIVYARAEMMKYLRISARHAEI